MLKSEAKLNQEAVLEAADAVLRRFGPSKLTIVDVAAKLEISHSAVYKYFSSKAELRHALAKRWLARIMRPLEGVVSNDLEAPEKLALWLRQLHTIKREVVTEEPEFFEAYKLLTADNEDVTNEHVSELLDQISTILSQGVDEGTLESANPEVSARVVFDATIRFHHPAHSSEWTRDETKDDLENSIEMILLSLGRRQES